MNVKHKEIKGIVPAPITPRTSQREIDHDSLAKHIHYLVNGGVHGLYIGGTTAEGAYLTGEERLAVIATIKKVVGEDITLFSTILQSNTPAVIREIAAVADTGVDYISAVPPFYMHAEQEAILSHYRQIADVSPLPCMMYTIPRFVNNHIEAETANMLAQHSNIVGIKDSSGQFSSFMHGMLTCPDPDFVWMQGEDLLDTPSFMLGGKAIVTGVGNVDISPYIRLYQAACDKDWERAKVCQLEINALVAIVKDAGGAVVEAIKSGVALRGRAGHEMLMPGMDLPQQQIAAIRTRLSKLNLL